VKALVEINEEAKTSPQAPAEMRIFDLEFFLY
jgi:hypothetical protein